MNGILLLQESRKRKFISQQQKKGGEFMGKVRGFEKERGRSFIGGKDKKKTYSRPDFVS